MAPSRTTGGLAWDIQWLRSNCFAFWLLEGGGARHILLGELRLAAASYGFRPGRGQHDALDALHVGILRKRVMSAVLAAKPSPPVDPEQQTLRPLLASL
jgi:hypothetical protein